MGRIADVETCKAVWMQSCVYPQSHCGFVQEVYDDLKTGADDSPKSLRQSNYHLPITNYSYRNASTGSKFAALFAG